MPKVIEATLFYTSVLVGALFLGFYFNDIGDNVAQRVETQIDDNRSPREAAFHCIDVQIERYGTFKDEYACAKQFRRFSNSVGEQRAQDEALAYTAGRLLRRALDE
jgi:hypothetical protein